DSSDPLCSKRWMQYGLSCYFISLSPRPWNVSKKDCEDMGAHLIVINSEGEMFSECIFRFWEKDQPDDWTGHGYGGGEDCAVLRPSSNEWNDGHCSPNFWYVCEKKIIF
ncbi:hypothetical protein AB205_0008070, partial [Aquarana catesbeiana]